MITVIGIQVFPKIKGMKPERLITKPQKFTHYGELDLVKETIRLRYANRWPKCEVYFEIT